jgi:hypothetical protein
MTRGRPKTPQPRLHHSGPGMNPAAPQLRPVTLPWPIFGWEYHEATVAYAKPWDTLLNRLGLEGWELVATLHDESSESKDYHARLLFKRPRPELPNEDELRGLGWKNHEVFTTWLEEARQAYSALVAGQRAEAEGRVHRGRDEDEDEPAVPTDSEDDEPGEDEDEPEDDEDDEDDDG